MPKSSTTKLNQKLNLKKNMNACLKAKVFYNYGQYVVDSSYHCLIDFKFSMPVPVTLL